jgi:hypothetical protein
MTWQRRILELVCAGGTYTALAGCPGGFPVPCGNANPDPCICGRNPPDSPECRAETACQDEGGTWYPYGERTVLDAGSGVTGQCVFPGDPGPVDAANLDAQPRAIDAAPVPPDAP